MMERDRIEALEQRVRHLEDVLEILHLMASYGPAVDSASGIGASLWEEDGIYDHDVGVWNGRRAIEEMLDSDQTRAVVRAGFSHQMGLPRVDIRGDEAVATCYTSLMERVDDSHVVRRHSANRWELVRTEQGWRARRRTNRLLDGGEAGPDLLRRGLDEH